jgi:uncharacterized membrane protein
MPMTERQRKYRENYRERVAGWYNGWLHILLIYTIGFTALYVYIANLHDVRWWEYLVRQPRSRTWSCDCGRSPHRHPRCQDRGPVRSVGDRADQRKRDRLQAVAKRQYAKGVVAQDAIQATP